MKRLLPASYLAARMAMDKAKAMLLVLLLLLVLAGSCARGAGSQAASAGPIAPPPASPPEQPHPGLVAVAAGDARVRLDWNMPPAGMKLSLFHATDPKAVYQSAPIAENLNGDHLVLLGLNNGTVYFFGLGVRRDSSMPATKTPETPETLELLFDRVGLVLRARPAAPIYVDAKAQAQGADGKTPQTAFPDLRSGVFAAASLGGGNVWLQNGQYEAGSLDLFPGVAVYGGFEAGFDLEKRRAGAGETVVLGTASPVLFAALGGSPAAVLDGLLLDGRKSTFIGIDTDNSPIETRSLAVRNFADRGMRLRNSSLTSSIEVQVAGCIFAENGGDGLSVQGAYDLRVFGSRFESNAQEGMDLDDLVALSDETASLDVSACRFYGNGAEGLDADLAAPLFPGTRGGRFSIRIQNCSFELNGLDGLLIDEEYEFYPDWSARILVAECTARGNLGSGIHVDADARADLLLHRVLATANSGDGILISSETDAGLALVSASVVAGNLGAGMRATFGYKGIHASHCIFAGNFGGGLVSEVVESSATSCIAYLQKSPWQKTHLGANVQVLDPGTRTFVHAAQGYAKVLAQSAATLTLETASHMPEGSVVELADDGVARVAAQVLGPNVLVDKAPEIFLAPGSLSWFGQKATAKTVEEDYHLGSGSLALGKGMSAAGSKPVDAGVHGSPAAGTPGNGKVGSQLAPPLFWLTQTAPALPLGIGAHERLVIVFSTAVHPLTLTLGPGQLRALSRSGKPITVSTLVLGDQIHVLPPSGGWGTEPLTIELHAGIASQTGNPLSTPMALPLIPR